MQRGRIKVSCYVGNKYGTIQNDPTDYLVYSITNIGREPVMLTHIGGQYSKTKHFMITTTSVPLPHMLNPGEYILESFDDLTCINDELKCLTVIDSLDRVWKAPKKQVKKMKKDCASGKYNKI